MQENDLLEILPENYTIFVKNIPINFKVSNDDYKDDLKYFLEKSINLPTKEKLNIKEINFCYNLTEFIEIDNKK